MDIDKRIEALTQSVELLASLQTDGVEAFEERSLRYEERLLAMAEHQHEAAIRHDREMVEIRRELGRGVRASVHEARAERKRRQELGAEMTKRHEELEALLKQFLERKH